MSRALICFVVLVKLSCAQQSDVSTLRNDSHLSMNPTPSISQVNKAISLAAGYLENACGPEGKFKYAVSTRTRQESESYNIVRHAGAIYALAMYNRSKPDRKAVEAMVRAARFMQKNYVRPGERYGQLAVRSESIGPRSDGELGPSALGLVALAEVRKVAPRVVSLNELQGLGLFLLSLQREDGSFVEKYNGELGPQQLDNLYYPGEAALGLVELYEADHAHQWADAALRALSSLAKDRGSLFITPPDHWFLIAAAELFSACKNHCPAWSENLPQYASKICDAIVREQLHNPSSFLDGAFDQKGQTGPVAARMEGLLAVMRTVSDNALCSKMNATVKLGVAFLLRAQIKAGPFAGGLPTAVLAGTPESSEIRIDNVQHALTSWLVYEHLAIRGAKPAPNDCSQQIAWR